MRESSKISNGEGETMSLPSLANGTSMSRPSQKHAAVGLFELGGNQFIDVEGEFFVAKAAGLIDAIPTSPLQQRQERAVTLRVNGCAYTLTLDTRTSLLDALRDHLGLPGSKKGCGHGQCGACTVLSDGRRVNSCLTLALSAQGKEITTIEGLAKIAGPTEIRELHPMQAAFLEHDGFQCGYCTSGQIVSAVGALNEHEEGRLSIVSFHSGHTDHPVMTDDEIRERMSGNLCRCAAYPNIVSAIRAVSQGAFE